MHRGAWWATVHGVAESDMTEHAHMQRFNTRVHGIPTTALCGSTVASPVFSGKIIKAQRS